MKLAMDNYSSGTPHNNSFISVKRNRDDDDVYAYSNYHQCNLIDNNQCIMLENKIYENTNMPFLFFSGTSRFEFKPHYFNFPFRFSHTLVESKDNISINILSTYNDNAELYIAFQIGDEHSFPKTQNKFNTLDNIATNIPNEHCCYNNKTKISNTTTNTNVNAVSFEYKVSIFASLISFTTIQYDFEVSKGDTKWLRIPFKDTFINAVNNDNDNNGVDKSLVLICEISIIKNQHYLSNKLKPPFCGLINNGTTCYMNSLLQLLYNITYFKKEILSLKLHRHFFKVSKLYSLQKLFYEMLRSIETPSTSENMIVQPVSTSSLVSAFGWSNEQLQTQHDVQEFFLLLKEIIDTEIHHNTLYNNINNSNNNISNNKHTNAFAYLFEGKLQTHVKCLNVQYESYKDETFYDIQLPIKNFPDITTAFKSFSDNELLTGINKYETTLYGKQDAHKRQYFTSFPRVLVIQLKRFHFNNLTKQMEKINDKFIFTDHLDLSSFASPQIRSHVVSRYSCFGVVVHSGSIDSGHYYSYIKHYMSSNNCWYKLNDTQVSLAETYEVFTCNYGGNIYAYNYDMYRGCIAEMKTINNSSAYLLVYVRQDVLDELFTPEMKLCDVPKETVELFHYEQRKVLKSKMKMNRNANYVKVNVITKEMLCKRRGLGVVDNYNIDDIKYNRLRLNVHKDVSVDNIVEIICECTNTRKDKISVYKFNMKDDVGYVERFCYEAKFIRKSNYGMRLFEMFNIEGKKKEECWFYVHYVESAEEDVKLVYEIEEEENHVSNCDGSDNKNSNDDSDDGNDMEEQYIIKHYLPSKAQSIKDKQQQIHINNNAHDYDSICDNKIIYYNRKDNVWHFYRNINTSASLNSPPPNDMHYANTDNVLIILKYPHLPFKHNNKSNNINTSSSNSFISSLSLPIHSIYQIESKSFLTQQLSKHALKTSLLTEASLKHNTNSLLQATSPYITDITDIQYLIEYSSLYPFMLDFPLDFRLDFQFKTNKALCTYKNDILCLILDITFKTKLPLTASFPNNTITFSSYRELISLKYSNYFYTLNTVFYYTNTNININAIAKASTCTLSIDTNVNEIKRKIFDLISNDNMLYLLFTNGNDIYKEMKFTYAEITSSVSVIKPLLTVFNDVFNKYGKYELIELIKFKNEQQLHNNNSYTLLNYVNTKRNNTIAFTFNLKTLLQTYNTTSSTGVAVYEITICDFYSNPLYKVFMPLSTYSNETTFVNLSERLNTFLTRTQTVIPTIQDYEYIFILHNAQTFITYDMFYQNTSTNKVSDYLEKYPHVEVRYQPMMISDRFIFKRKECVVFVCVYENDKAVMFPFVVYYDLERTKIAKFKKDIGNIIRKNKTVLDKGKDDRIRFYRCFINKEWKPDEMVFIGKQYDDCELVRFKLVKKPFNVCVVIGEGSNSNNNKCIDINNNNKVNVNSLGIVVNESDEYDDFNNINNNIIS